MRHWLTSGARQDHSPAWSPDGKRLAFVSNRDGTDAVYLVDADGTGERRRVRGHPMPAIGVRGQRAPRPPTR